MSLTSSDDVSNKLICNLYAQKKSNKFCDLKLKMGERFIYAHACVVASFSLMVDNSLQESLEVMSSMGKVNFLVDVPLSLEMFCECCANKVVDFMYVGKIQIEDNKHLEHIKEISRVLQVPELQKICEFHSDKLKEEITPDRAASFKNQALQGHPLTYSLKGGIQAVSSTSVINPLKDAKSASNNELLLSKNQEDNKLSDSLNSYMEEDWTGLSCPKCQMTFTSVVKFQQHCSTHLGRVYTTCFICNFATLKVPDLIKHLKEEDHGESVCSLCLYVASSSEKLKEHLQQHDHPQPFFCQTCNTRFQTRTALNSHIVKHSSETPFRCKECGRGFKWKHGLQNHMVTHTSVKKLLCDQCGYSTAHLKSFIDHKIVHSGLTFNCPMADCKFKSVRKESVKHHLSTHSKEKPYQCEVCGQAFSQAKNLRRHAAIHDASVDPEQCPLCPFQTNRSDKFRDHFRLYHKNDDQSKTQLLPSKGNKTQRKYKPKTTRKNKEQVSVKTTALDVKCDDTSTSRINDSKKSISQPKAIPVVLPSIATLPLSDDFSRSNPTAISVISSLQYPLLDGFATFPFNFFNDKGQFLTSDGSSVNFSLLPDSHFTDVNGFNPVATISGQLEEKSSEFNSTVLLPNESNVVGLDSRGKGENMEVGLPESISVETDIGPTSTSVDLQRLQPLIMDKTDNMKSSVISLTCLENMQDMVIDQSCQEKNLFVDSQITDNGMFIRNTESLFTNDAGDVVLESRLNNSQEVYLTLM